VPSMIWFIGREWGGYQPEVSILKEAMPDCIINFSETLCDDDLNSFGQNADAIITQTTFQINRSVIERLQRCKVISVYGIGYNNVDIDAATEKGIYVTNVPGYCVEEVSDHTLSFIFYCARTLGQSSKQIPKGLWEESAITDMPIRIKGSTLLLIGFGRIARAVAEKAVALGINVLTYDPYVDEQVLRLHRVKCVALDEGLKVSDFVSVHVPYNAKTKSMIGKEQFERMKPSAYFINMSRGEIVDEKALLEAVKTGVIAGAALDVVSDEPPNVDREILNCDRIFVTPHIAYASHSSIIELKTRVAKNVVQALAGNKPEDCVV
jgi:D-3-phosphoglycerate dehydrogenase